MITKIGKFLRKLRIDKGEILKDMATKLDVSSAFLSAVENGKKKFPDTWYKKIENLYSLSTQQVAELKAAVLESNDKIELNVKHIHNHSRQLAVSFARNFESLDFETSQKILELLNNVEED